ncbi:hypothetical protein [Sphingobium limneticum]|nr:hypothetical protein [Sphingobium limneticum]
MTDLRQRLGWWDRVTIAVIGFFLAITIRIFMGRNTWHSDDLEYHCL